MRFFLSLISVFGLASASGGAIAQPATSTIGGADVRQVTVQHRDLDLRTRDGAATLKGRVDRAVRQVCASDGSRSLFDRTQQRSCARQAGRQADADVARTISSARQSSIAFGSLRQGPNWER